MSRIRSKFEVELKAKIAQKTPGNLSEETYLLKTFKFFDLDNSKTISKQEWIRAIGKIGVVVEDPHQLDNLFEIYDESKDGFLDYREFVASIYSSDSSIGKQIYPQILSRASELQRAEELFEVIRETLKARGARGLIGLARQFKIMDDIDSGTLEFDEFVKCFRVYRLQVSEDDAQLLFNYIARENNDYIYYNEFLNALTGQIHPFRKSLIANAFRQLELDGNGSINIEKVRKSYDPRSHPDVSNGKQTEEEVLNEFLETFEMHHSLYGGRDGTINYHEFEDYYKSISANIDNDHYFEAMMKSSWRLNTTSEITPKKAERETSRPFSRVDSSKSSKNKAEHSLERLRMKLASRGARGILGLARQFKIMDDDGSKCLNLNELKQAFRDFRLGIEDSDVEVAFASIDKQRNGEIDYDELLRAIRGPINQFRRRFVDQAWNKLEKDKNGLLELEDLKRVYSARQHPDVRSGRKSQDEVFDEFIETFDMHHSVSDLSRRDRKITKEEFTEYYANVSSVVDEDSYFELIMTNTWRLNQDGQTKGTWSNEQNTTHSRQQWLADHHRSQFGGSVSSTAPFGTSDEPIDYSTTFRPSKREDVDLLDLVSKIPVAGTPSWTANLQYQTTNQSQIAQENAPEELLRQFKEKLVARGARGFIGIARQFRILGDDRSKSLNINEFIKALRDFRLDINDENATRLFRYFDIDRTGTINNEELMNRVRGEMNHFRKQLILQAFNKLDRNRNGVVKNDDLRGIYNVSSHPDVMIGKITEDEALCEFLDTFEIHHSLYKDGKRDTQVTKDEFLEYYAYISASIDDDRYFELVIRNAWNFDSRGQQKGRKGQIIR